MTEAEEFYEIYNLTVVVIPTNNPMIRKDYNDQIFQTEEEKNKAIIKQIKNCHEKGQPLLVFTSSVNKSEVYSKLLKADKIKHVVLNAKNHENEAEIIANAGKEGSIIITTSISGRGVDIQLGGKKGSIPDTQLYKEKEKIKSLGGLFVIGTERMESRRVDNQARGRSGGAIALASSNKVIMLENAIYSVISPEGCATILWRDPKKMLDAAKAMKLSAKDLLDLKVIDEIVSEPLGGAHRDRNLILNNLRETISKNLFQFKDMTPEEIFNQRKNKFLKIGRGKGFISNPENLSTLDDNKNYLIEYFKKKQNFYILIGSFVLILLAFLFL